MPRRGADRHRGAGPASSAGGGASAGLVLPLDIAGATPQENATGAVLMTELGQFAPAGGHGTSPGRVLRAGGSGTAKSLGTGLPREGRSGCGADPSDAPWR